MSERTIFERILAGEIPANKLFEDNDVLAFHDINPQAPVHVVVIPKRKITCIAAAEPADIEALGKLLLATKRIAELTGIASTGYRLVINNGEQAGQTVNYLHCHVLGGRDLGWPPG